MPRPASGLFAAAALALAGALTSCAHRPQVVEAPPPAPVPPRPVLATAYQSVRVPPAAPDGGYLTINHGIGPERTIWHVRAALNVAAISCRGPESAALVAAYNGLLASHKALLGKANTAVEAEFKTQGTDWQDAHDRYMTRLYNFFAMPQASTAFCAVAATLAPRARETDDAAFPAFAETALVELETPFLTVYRTIDDYKVQVADWDARYGPDAPQTAAAATSPSAAPQLAYQAMDSLIGWEQTPQRTAMR